MPSKRGETSCRTTLLAQRAADFGGLLEVVGDAVVGVHAERVIRFSRRWKEVPFGRGQLLTKRWAT